MRSLSLCESLVQGDASWRFNGQIASMEQTGVPEVSPGLALRHDVMRAVRLLRDPLIGRIIAAMLVLGYFTVREAQYRWRETKWHWQHLLDPWW